MTIFNTKCRTPYSADLRGIRTIVLANAWILHRSQAYFYLYPYMFLWQTLQKEIQVTSGALQSVDLESAMKFQEIWCLKEYFRTLSFNYHSNEITVHQSLERGCGWRKLRNRKVNRRWTHPNQWLSRWRVVIWTAWTWWSTIHEQPTKIHRILGLDQSSVHKNGDTEGNKSGGCKSCDDILRCTLRNIFKCVVLAERPWPRSIWRHSACQQWRLTLLCCGCGHETRCNEPISYPPSLLCWLCYSVFEACCAQQNASWFGWHRNVRFWLSPGDFGWRRECHQWFRHVQLI